MAWTRRVRGVDGDVAVQRRERDVDGRVRGEDAETGAARVAVVHRLGVAVVETVGDEAARGDGQVQFGELVGGFASR